ncbi:MAG: SUMF1/EgtB/PvdO family nonheme iron enzyme, partial [Myxococcales bacterium]|nr:SUMF1/EgtB/PvdO family nonheme iron enzyme [Myxococcales bacterium]
MTIDLEAILDSGADGVHGDAGDYVVAADYFVGEGRPAEAAAALDRAYGLDLDDATIAAQRRDLLERMTVVEHGLVFRYVPAGTFLMGSTTGEPDERPVHAVRLGAYWICDVPIRWSAFCALLDWDPPPRSAPRNVAEDPEWEERRFYLHQANKIRMQYCESRTQQAGDWHSHDPSLTWRAGDGPLQSGAALFGEPARDDPSRPWTYDRKPMVCVGWPEAEVLAQRMSNARVRYELPSEAEWEKAA